MKCRSCYILYLTVALPTFLPRRNYSVWSDKLTRPYTKSLMILLTRKMHSDKVSWFFSSVYVLYI